MKRTFTALINAEDGEGIEFLYAVFFDAATPEDMEREAVIAYNALYGDEAFESWGGEIVAFMPGAVQVCTWNAAQGSLAEGADEAWHA